MSFYKGNLYNVSFYIGYLCLSSSYIGKFLFPTSYQFQGPVCFQCNRYQMKNSISLFKKRACDQSIGESTLWIGRDQCDQIGRFIGEIIFGQLL